MPLSHSSQFSLIVHRNPSGTLLGCRAFGDLVWPGLQCEVDLDSETMFKSDNEC